ncbi:MAG: hypothetical protein JW715_12840 [Sedimentisphaerales bacterium]|nr:hypothetical protein [Sedimentisphaerales bacterium]
MDEPDVNHIEKRLSEILGKERREAIGYAIMTVLCTPFFAAIVGFVVMIIMVILRYYFFDIEVGYENDLIYFYTILNVFLAYMIVFIFQRTFSLETDSGFDITWLVAVVIFLLLLFLTYVTKLPVKSATGFGILYAVTSFFILGLLGRVYMDLPIAECDDDEHPIYAFILAVTGFIAMSYGELLNGSWLWIPPKQDEVRLCSWILCKLAMEEKVPLHNGDSVQKRVLHILSRLKLVQVKEGLLQLTLKGRNLVYNDKGE